jgi:hypothetical protein
VRLRSSARSFDGRLDLPPVSDTGDAVRPLAEIMIANGMLSQADVDEISARQSRSDEDFVTAAVALGKVSPVVLEQFLSGIGAGTILPPGDAGVDPLVVTAFDPLDPYAVEIRTVRAGLLSHWQDNQKTQRALAIVGLDASVDIAPIMANLAVAWAQLGWSTLLVDSDLEQARQHDLFRVDGGGGLTDILQGASGANWLTTRTAIEGLSLLPAGPPVANPSELLENAPLLGSLQAVGAANQLILAGLSRTDGRHAGAVDHIFRGFDAAVVVVGRDRSSMKELEDMVAQLEGGGLDVFVIVDL